MAEERKLPLQGLKVVELGYSFCSTQRYKNAGRLGRRSN